MLDLWLIRHGESLGNLDGSGSDSPLTEAGIAQSRALAGALGSTVFSSVHSSPLLRARQTATLAIPSASLVIAPELAELKSSRSPTYVDPSDSAQIAALLASRPAASESGADFKKRVSRFIAELPTEGAIAAFTHFAVIREVIAAFFGFLRAPQQIDFTGVFRFAIDLPEVQVVSWNDTQHLQSC